MGKTQSKRSVDITTETKKGTEDEITEKMEKIEDLDKKEVLNGEATISEKADPEKNDTEVENDMTTEKDVVVQTSGDAAETQNVIETSKDESASAAVEEISPLADESAKKSKKEKVKKKWSFRSISFGKKDKQKPAKSEDAAEDGSAAINGSDADEKTKDPEDTPKEKSANEIEEKTKDSFENGNASPVELNGGEQNAEKPSDEKSNDITANTTNNTTNTETCEPVQNETAAATSELSEKTESTDVINETKISENATVDDTSKNGNGVDDKINATDQEPQNKDVTNTSAEISSDKTSTLAIAVKNESSIITNGELIDKIHQNGDHGESEQKLVEKSKAQIEVNFNTDNKVSAATLDSISSTSITPSNVQIHAQDLNASSEKPDEIIQINDESVINKSTVTEINIISVDQSLLSEIVSMVDVKNNLEISAASDFMLEAIDYVKSSEEKLGVDPSPPPLPISPPPSQVSVFAFTNNDESVQDSLQAKGTESTINSANMEEEIEIFPPIRELPNNCQETGTIPIEIIDEKKTSNLEQINFKIQYQENNEVEDEKSLYKDLNKDNAPPSVARFEESQIEDEASVAVAAAVIDEIADLAAEIVNQQLKCNEEHITDKQFSQSNEKNEENKVNNKNIFVEYNDNKPQNNEDHFNEQDVINNSSEYLLVVDQTGNDSIEISLGFTTSDSIQQDHDEMNSLKKCANLEENHLDPTKEFGTGKDIKDNITVAEITQDLSVTCE